MLASLTDESQLRAVRLVVRIFPAHLFGEGACGNHLHGRGTAQPCSCGNVTIVEQVITALQFSLRMAATDDLEASQGVVTPSAIRLRSDSVHRDLIHLGHVQRTEPQYAVVILGDQEPSAETECARKNATTVVIGVLADKINTTRGEEDFLSFLMIGLLESLFHFLCCHSSGKMRV